MNKEVANILLAALDGATYLDRTSGVVQVVVRQVIVDQEQGISITKRVPYSSSATFLESAKMSEMMVPDSRYKSCLYFEDSGIVTSEPLNVRAVQYLSRLRLVCWLNMKDIAGGYDTAETAKIMADVMKRIRKLENSNSGVFIAIRPRITNIPIQSQVIFQNYDYDETVSQYLFPPFDYFALDIETTFRLGDPCIESFTDNTIV
jgi:hypothetical protein